MNKTLIRPIQSYKALASILSLVVLSACGGGSGDSEPNGSMANGFPVSLTEVPADNLVPESEQIIIPNEQMRAFRSDSPYASVLKDCVLAETDSLCTNSQLPYIGQDHIDPTINDILNRLIVSHDWMGVRFTQFLQQMPQDMLTLFKPITAISIGSEIRPSSFSSFRGSMKIDPDYLWLTLSEKRTVSPEDDFRSNFGADLRFVHLSRYMIDNQVAYPFFSLENDDERSLNDILLRTANLLFHELAHANDYVRPELFDNINPDETPRDLREKFEDQRISEILQADQSLSVQASWLFGLASVRYRDEETTDQLLAFDAQTTGSTMGNEGKTKFYSYSTIREDMATLFETAMMKKHFGTNLYTAFTEKPAGYPDSFTCNEFVVGWGEDNRLTAPLVAPRAKFVVESVFGETAANNNFFSNDQEGNAPLETGIGWCDILYPPTQLATTRDAREQQKHNAEIQQLRELQRLENHLVEQ